MRGMRGFYNYITSWANWVPINPPQIGLMTIKLMCSHNPDYTHETLRQYYKKNQYWNVNINIELMKVCVKLYNSEEAPQLYAG